MLSGETLILLLLEVPLEGTALPPIRYSHAGICPNDMNPNLWVDAQSTCRRECDTDLVSDALFFSLYAALLHRQGVPLLLLFVCLLCQGSVTVTLQAKDYCTCIQNHIGWQEWASWKNR